MSDLTELRDRMRAFTAERDWARFHDPKSLLLALMGEVGELSELFQWLPAEQAAPLAGEEPLRTRVGRRWPMSSSTLSGWQTCSTSISTPLPGRSLVLLRRASPSTLCTAPRRRSRDHGLAEIRRRSGGWNRAGVPPTDEGVYEDAMRETGYNATRFLQMQ